MFLIFRRFRCYSSSKNRLLQGQLHSERQFYDWWWSTHGPWL